MILQSFSLFMPTILLFGSGTAKKVGIQAKHIGAQRVMIVTDVGVLKVGHLDNVKKYLQSQGLHIVAVFDQTETQPTIPNLERCIAVAQKASPDVIVGLGGGSCIDVAKMAAALLVNEGSFRDYIGIDKIPKRGLPTILLPTTSGTGSEVSRVAAIRDPEDNRKKLVVSPLIVSTVSIIDPVLTATMPPSLTAATGIDALSHAIEAYLSVNAARITELFALEAIRLLSANLESAYSDGTNMKARTNMALGSLFASIAVNSGACAPHALSFALGAEFPVSHGIAVYLVLPAVLEYTAATCPDKMAVIATALGVSIDGLSLTQAATKGIQAIRALGTAVGLPAGLREAGVELAKLPSMAEAARTEERLLSNHPRKLLTEDILAIYNMAY